MPEKAMGDEFGLSQPPIAILPEATEKSTRTSPQKPPSPVTAQIAAAFIEGSSTIESFKSTSANPQNVQVPPTVKKGPPKPRPKPRKANKGKAREQTTSESVELVAASSTLGVRRSGRNRQV